MYIGAYTHVPRRRGREPAGVYSDRTSRAFNISILAKREQNKEKAIGVTQGGREGGREEGGGERAVVSSWSIDECLRLLLGLVSSDRFEDGLKCSREIQPAVQPLCEQGEAPLYDKGWSQLHPHTDKLT